MVCMGAFVLTNPKKLVRYLHTGTRRVSGREGKGSWTMKTHILCLGDSNTHGYCADPADCADGGTRFNEEERWTCLLQTALGPGVLVTEEGLSGRKSEAKRS